MVVAAGDNQAQVCASCADFRLAPVIDFCKIIEIQDESGRRIPRAKRGDLAGRKNVFRDPETMSDVVTARDNLPDGRYVPLLHALIRNGKIVREFAALDDLRERTRSLVKKLNSVTPSLRWELGEEQQT
jgi:hypothetical protein